MSTWTQQRAKVAGLSRDRTSDDPELIAARRDLRAVRLEDYVRKAVESLPPLTPDQLRRIAVLLLPSGGDER